MDNAHDIADLITKFYAAYGTNGEGPRNFDEARWVAEVAGGESARVRDEVNLISKLVEDNDLMAEFLSCRSTLDQLANRASGGDLLKEIVANGKAFAFERDRLFNGVIWYGMVAAIGNLARQKPPILVLPTPEGIDEFPALARQIIGSNVLMAYIALVYMRNDHVLHALESLDLKRCPVLALYNDLLGSNVIRRLRNALAHGTIDTSIVGLRFSDVKANFEAIATPGFLVGMCTWMFVFFDTMFMVCMRGQEGGISPADESLQRQRIESLQSLFRSGIPALN